MHELQVVTRVDELREALAETVAGAETSSPVVGLVPTMGALHPGHSALLDAARKESDVVVASVFVNPLQFDDEADYLHYPRDLDKDLELQAAHGADLVFAPEVEEMYPGYPDGPLVRVSAGELGRRWEGAARPGHFDGVVTVVNKLFNIVTPPAPARLEAWFGQKDAEQLAIITRMARDFDHRVGVRSLPIVRDEHGMALSSRNQRLGPENYRAALELSRALFALQARAEAAEPLDVAGLVAGFRAAAGIELDYLVVVDPATLREVREAGEVPAGSGADSAAGSGAGSAASDDRTPRLEDGVLRGEALALIAARTGPVRLIDNMPLQPLGQDPASSSPWC